MNTNNLINPEGNCFSRVNTVTIKNNKNSLKYKYKVMLYCYILCICMLNMLYCDGDINHNSEFPGNYHIKK